ncbi:MAG: hypothetical protein GX221_03620 [Candidatus Riflebacteria bacterium]|nr:hypothetical protein [Candidatus Riflebacteria bacterium]
MGMWTINADDLSSGGFTAEELDGFEEQLAGYLVEKRMTAPAVVALEMSKPLSFVGYSILSMFAPAIRLIADPRKLDKFIAIAHNRTRINSLITKIELKEKIFAAKEKGDEQSAK